MKEKGQLRGRELALLLLALVSFGGDLFHFAHHLTHEPTLVKLPGVLPKLVWKSGFFLALLALAGLSLRQWTWGAMVGILIGIHALPGSAAMTHESCERAQKYLKNSGVARDAKENFLGRVKVTPPETIFPPEMDKVTWWGTFKPFEFWESPKFEAVWINPHGEPADRQIFRGGQCQLAKTTLSTSKLPRGRLEPGTWRVRVSCEDIVIDNHPFAVLSPPPQAGDTAGGEPIMIWAEEE